MNIGDLVRGTSYPFNGKMGVIIEQYWTFWEEETGFLVLWNSGRRTEAGEYSLEVIG